MNPMVRKDNEVSDYLSGAYYDKLEKIREMTNSGISVEDISNKLDMTPIQVRDFLQAIKLGLRRIKHGKVGIKKSAAVRKGVQGGGFNYKGYIVIIESYPKTSLFTGKVYDGYKLVFETDKWNSADAAKKWAKNWIDNHGEGYDASMANKSIVITKSFLGKVSKELAGMVRKGKTGIFTPDGKDVTAEAERLAIKKYGKRGRAMQEGFLILADNGQEVIRYENGNVTGHRKIYNKPQNE